MAITEEKALIKIASETSGAQIRYTINGEDPTESDTLYTSSGVELDYGDVLRAKAFKSGSMPSNVGIYNNFIPNISIEKIKSGLVIGNTNFDRIKKVGSYYFAFLPRKNSLFNISTPTVYYTSDIEGSWEGLNLFPATSNNPSNYYIPQDVEFFGGKYYFSCVLDNRIGSGGNEEWPIYVRIVNDSLTSVEKDILITSQYSEVAIRGGNQPTACLLATSENLYLSVCINHQNGNNRPTFILYVSTDGEHFTSTYKGENSGTDGNINEGLKLDYLNGNIIVGNNFIQGNGTSFSYFKFPYDNINTLLSSPVSYDYLPELIDNYYLVYDLNSGNVRVRLLEINSEIKEKTSNNFTGSRNYIGRHPVTKKDGFIYFIGYNNGVNINILDLNLENNVFSLQAVDPDTNTLITSQTSSIYNFEGNIYLLSSNSLYKISIIK